MLITTIADQYNEEKRCSIFREKDLINLFIGLGDILRIIGLPICGWPVISWLKSTFGHWDDRVLEGAELERYVKAFVLYIIGSIVLPSTAHVVSSIFLTFLSNVDEIGRYARATTMLATLHKSLEDHKKM